MTDRCRVDLEVVTEPVGGVAAVPLTEQELTQVLAEGSARLAPEELERIRALVPCTRFRAAADQSLAVPDGRDGCLYLVGRGRAGSSSLRRAAAVAAGLVPAGREWSLRLGGEDAEEEAAGAVRAVVEGMELGTYRFRIGEAIEHEAPAGRCRLVVPAAAKAVASAAADRARSVCEGVLLTRDLINAPASELGPQELAEAAATVARRHGWEHEVLDGDAVEERGFRMVAAVGRGSSRPATVTTIRIGAATAKPALALVGKGVVFDSGGLNLKPPEGMLLMRKDMGGAGTLIGVLEALGRLGVTTPISVVLPSAENLPGPTAYRPGDILRSYSGKTVEIGNTDAEGRLLLADALEHACEQEPARVLDVATLTGAARIALGPDVPPLFGTDEALVEKLLHVSQQLDEPLWRMPLVDGYRKLLDTPSADVNHIGSEKRAGAITAALFLQRFVGDVPWCHVDLYGWEDQGRPEAPKGANGMLVRTLTEAISQLPTLAA